jgi:hypothetical protein
MYPSGPSPMLSYYSQSGVTSGTVQNHTDWEVDVSELDCLILDAKQAILHEQYRRFQELQQEKKWAEAMQQFQTTMSCASDLLNESLGLLERVLEKQRLKSQPPPPSAPPPAP